MTDADRDRVIVSLTAFAEASDQGQAGIRAQIWSVINRHNAGRWYSRKTLAGTCLEAYAFSAMNTADPNRERAAETPTDNPFYAICVAETDGAMAGTTQDPTNGATHYYAAGTPEPSWVSGIDPKTGQRVAPPAVFLIQIGKHLFFNSVQ